MAPFIRLATSAWFLAALLGGGQGTAATAQAQVRKAEAAPIIAADVRTSAEGARTRLSVTLSKPVAARAFVMESPDRVVLDLPEVSFHLPADSGRKRDGVIASFRYGLFAPGRSRVVIDLVQPALPSRVAIEPNPADETAVLILELTKADREAFRSSAASAELPAVERPAADTAAENPQDRRPVIMIDPGHGGVDPGATASTGLFEKDIVFAFAQRLKGRLEAGGRYRVLMTRDQDVFVPLGERVRIARATKADLLISIHADSISGAAEIRGLTVYTGSERASDADSARLADRENKADAAAGVEPSEAPEEVVDILQDLTLRETRVFSYGFASRVVGELDGIARLNKNPQRQAGFRVLRAPDVPSVLVELGYLSSRKDIDLLMSDEWRDRWTSAMAAAVDRFFAARIANQGTAPVSP